MTGPTFLDARQQHSGMTLKCFQNLFAELDFSGRQKAELIRGRKIIKNPNRKTMEQLEDLPNVGKAMADDLRLVGIHQPRDIIGKNPYQLYAKLCTLTGKKHDPCVIDVFIAVVRFMEGVNPAPWWSFTEERKKHMNRK